MLRDNVLTMQVRIFHKFWMCHHIEPKDAVSVFEKFDIFGFISECYEVLCVTGDESILEDIDEIIHANGYCRLLI